MHDQRMKKIGDKAWAISGLIWWTARLFGMPAVAGLERSRFLRDYQYEIDSGLQAGRLKRAQKNGKWVWGWSDEVELRMRGEEDPQKAWNERWDEHWRLFCFDLPARRAKTRQRLIRSLKRLGFGKLQGSVWISPRDYPELYRLVEQIEISPTELSVFLAESIYGQSSGEIAQSAWRWDEIGSRYDIYLNQLEQMKTELRGELSLVEASHIIRQEAQYWLAAVEGDPLLPKELETEGYIGHEAWRKREDFIKVVLSGAAVG